MYILFPEGNTYYSTILVHNFPVLDPSNNLSQTLGTSSNFASTMVSISSSIVILPSFQAWMSNSVVAGMYGR